MNLIQYLNECARHYYNGTPIISDEIFDRLAESIDYKNIGAKQHEHLRKHYYPLYSLAKYYEDEGKINPLSTESDVSYSVKLDGAAISILYIDGQLTQVLTRGDGKEGTDVTEKFLGSKLIPQELHHTGVVQINGEIAAPKHIPNARNYAAGALNLKDKEEFKTRAIEFIAYGVQPYQYDTYEEDMDLLKRMGFSTVRDLGLIDVYPTDGIVFRVNSNKRAEELGYSTSWPNFAYALKERSAGVDTVLREVIWQTGRTGRVTPVALFDPIYIGDALISRATLNNIGFIEALGINIGDTINVAKAGEIIPCVMYKVE